jgi:hypothetical protein
VSTITKVLEARIGVDKQTIDAFFAAFSLQLERISLTILQLNSLAHFLANKILKKEFFHFYKLKIFDSKRI